MNGSGFDRIGDVFQSAGVKYKKRPRYTVVLHDVREKLGISLNTCVIIDSIHKLSTSDPKFPYCIMSKKDLSEFLCLSESTVYRSLTDAEEAKLIERSDYGLRAAEQWIKAVEIYSINKH
jgi:hypothetical protein